MYGKVEHNCSIFLIISIYLIGDYMELELVKKALIEVKNVLKIIDVNTEIKDYFINDKVINGNLNVNINYFDFNDEKNTLYRNIPFEIMLDEMKVTDVLFKEANAYIVEGIGLELEYKLIAKCETFFDKEIDIIKLDDLTNENNNLVDFKPEIDKSNDESKEKIKNKIENDYEKKLSESLVERDSTAVKNDNLVNETNHLEKRTDNFDNKLIRTKDVKNEEEFIKYFDKEVAGYFCIKTVECKSDKELDKISKEYKIPYDELIKGYDRDNGKVIFKLK